MYSKRTFMAPHTFTLHVKLTCCMLNLRNSASTAGAEENELLKRVFTNYCRCGAWKVMCQHEHATSVRTGSHMPQTSSQEHAPD